MPVNSEPTQQNGALRRDVERLIKLMDGDESLGVEGLRSVVERHEEVIEQALDALKTLKFLFRILAPLAGSGWLAVILRELGKNGG